MKYKSKYIKSGVSLALTAMMVTPTTAAFAAPIQEVNQDIKNENIPYNVLNQKTLSNPTSTAKPAKDPTKVYTSFTQSVSSNTGDGSAQRPYNRFEDAIAQVKDGGTIYIDASKGAFLNAQDEYGHLPFLIDKKVTIKPVNGASNAELSVRAGGIILGADVTFENITLSFANKYHDSIYANGHTLDLINVTRGSGTRKIDVFAGGLYERKNNVDSTTPIYPSGNKGVINIETNDNFGSTTYMSTFGNIYAGSMNGTFNGSAEINISNIGKHKKLDIGAIKASGALEADAGNMFDLTEPSAPAENPEEYPTTGDVTINLHNYQVSVDGETGSESKTSVTTSTDYPSTLELENVDLLTINGGTVKAVYPESSTGTTSIPKVAINNGATLDLTEAGDNITIGEYTGDGYVTLSKTGKLDITDKVEGTLYLQTDGAFSGYSGLVAKDHVYLTTPTGDANIEFKPHPTQRYLKLAKEEVDSAVNWKVIDDSANASLPPITDLSINPSNAKVVKTYAELNPKPIDGVTTYQSVYFPFTSTIEFPPDDELQSADLNEYPFEITINGIKAEYREDEGIFIGCHHYFVEELDLAVFFTVSDDGVGDNLTLLGYTEDFNLTGIDSGSYEIGLSYAKADGTLTGLTATLVVTDDVEQDDTKTGTSSIVLDDIGNLTLGSTIDIPVSITHEDNTKSTEATTETGTAYLYVNGQKVAEQEVTPSTKPDITFEDVTINASNNFKLGNNDILITYSGTDTYNGALESYTVEVIKATPELTLNSVLQDSYSFDYDGSAKGIGIGLQNKVNVTVNGVALTDYEEKVEYRNTSIESSEFTEELPYLPGEYETRIVVSEGEGYESAFIVGPSLTINKVQPKIKVSGVVENGNLTVKAHVSSVSTAFLPSGSAKFIVDGVEKATVKLVNGVATYTLEGLVGNTKTSTEGDGFVKPEVKVVYVDDIIINPDDNTTLYEEVESTPIEFKVASDWVSVTGVSLSEVGYDLNINRKTQLSASINEDATNKDVIWSIGNSAIAEISEDGVVTGVSQGETYVTVMTVDGGFEATAIIRVSGEVEDPSEGEDEGDGLPPSDGGDGELPPEDEDDELLPPEGDGEDLPPSGGGDAEPPEDDEIEPPTPEEVEPDEDGWLKAETLGEVAYLWDYEIKDGKVVLNSFKGVKTKTQAQEVKVEIPKTVGKYEVALADLDNSVFPNVTHIRIAEGEGTVKLLATEVSKGFADNNDLKDVNLKGLDVSDVTDMTMLFSKCPNLRVINILDWNIKETAYIRGMFFASQSATDEERKLLVLTNNKIFKYYNFGSLDGSFDGDNRIPSMYTFDANGGQFLDVGGVDIQHIQIPNFTFHLDKVEELDDLFDYYVDTITDPIQDGYAFDGWYTEDEPTNVYDVLNMTYKAKWVKLGGGTTPEGGQPPTGGGEAGGDKPTEPPSNEGNEEDTPTEPQPPNGPQPPTGGDDTEGDDTEGDGNLPPSEEGTKPPSNGGTTPPTEGEGTTPPSNGGTTPPVNGGGSTGGGTGGSTGGGSTGGGSTDSDTNNNGDSNNGVEDANKPENKFKVNLEGLDEELKTKVDSLVTSVTSVITESQKELMLSLGGDQEDLQHVTDVVINKDGIFITVGNEQVKVTDKLPTTDIDFTNARVVRLVDNKFVPVMHYTNGEGLRITSGNINDLIITSKVKEPFTDVKDDAWYHDDVEEIFNYGFTQGTTATTYSPTNEITRGEFVVMIARALELKPSSETSKFKDIDGKWYQNEAQALYELGIIKGNTDGTFGGDKTITRQEAATFITRMLTHINVDITVGNTVDFIDMDDISAFAKESVQYLASQGVLVGGGDNKFNPTNNLTRAEMAKILIRTLKLTDWY